MDKKYLKPLVLGIVFIVAVIVTNFTMNRGNKDMTTTMSDASLPTIVFHHGESVLEELHGYVSEMNISEVRDGIVPIDATRVLPMTISTYGAGVDKIAYEIRTIDDKRLVADREVSDYSQSNNTISADLDIPNVLENDEEYLLTFMLSVDGRDVSYYTRIMQTNDYNVEECFDFAKQFHEMTFSQAGQSFIPTYMDSTTGERNVLDYVDLSCTLGQIMWGDFTGSPITTPVYSFKELNSSYNVVTIDYTLASVNDRGETEYYNVQEYYRLRMTAARMYVLNFERRTNQIFNGENAFIDEYSNIVLGMRNPDVEFKTNESGNIIGFVQEGDLWAYNTNENTISKIFSFRGPEGIDARENWNQHDIKIVRVDEAGSIDFIVYGYMNRGDHEGEVGTAVYHYDGIGNTVEEEAFIHSDSSYSVLKTEMGRLMYENDLGELFLMLEGEVYSLNLDSLEVKTLISGLKEGSYAVSESNRYFAWVESNDPNSSTEIKLIDLKDGTVTVFSKGNQQYIRPLGFIDEDFIYGAADTAKVEMDATGQIVFPMHELYIIDTNDYSEVKKYNPFSGYVGSIDVEGYTITVNLIAGADGYYSEAGTDSIMNREADANEKIFISGSDSETKKTVRTIVTSTSGLDNKTKKIFAKAVLLEENRDVDITHNSKDGRYYVYVKGAAVFATDSISDAITVASENAGIVVDSNQSYVWQRARQNSVNAFGNLSINSTDENGSSVAKCVSAMLGYNGVDIGVSEMLGTGKSVTSVLSDNIEGANVFEFSGVTTENIIFYVSQGSPVFAMTGPRSAVLVVGYNASSETLYYYDPDTKATSSMKFADADVMFSAGDYHYITYLK